MSRHAVVRNAPHEWADADTLFVACPTCDIEWGWKREAPGVFADLSKLASEHDAQCHSDTRESIAAYLDARADEVVDAGRVSERTHWSRVEIADWLRLLAAELRAGAL